MCLILPECHVHDEAQPSPDAVGKRTIEPFPQLFTMAQRAINGHMFNPAESLSTVEATADDFNSSAFCHTSEIYIYNFHHHILFIVSGLIKYNFRVYIPTSNITLI